MSHIKTYKQFNEAKDSTPESELSVSAKFRKVLSKIDTPLSKEILNLVGKKYPLVNNYFDVSEEGNDSITFITMRKVREMEISDIWTILSNERYLNNTPSNAKYYQIFDMEVPQSLSIPSNGSEGKIVKEWTSPNSGKTWVKFIPLDEKYPPCILNKEGLSGHMDVVYKKHRQTTKIGRAIKALLKICSVSVTDKDIENFVNKWKSSIDQINDKFSDFEIVKGEKIPEYYKSSNYEFPDDGQLGNSCMRHSGSDILSLYSDNDNVSMVILRSSNISSKIIGRSILWDNGKLKLMDRIYTTRDSDIELFREYAKKNGWYCKSKNQSSSELSVISPSGDISNIQYSIQLEGDCEYYPYMDTLKFFDPETFILSNDENQFTDTYYVLESTGGGYEECSPREKIWVDFYQDEFYESDLIYCDYAGVSGGYRLNDDCFYSEIYNTYICLKYAKENMVISESDKSYYLKKDAVPVYGHKDKYIGITPRYGRSRYPNDFEDYVFIGSYNMYVPNDEVVEVYMNFDSNETELRSILDPDITEQDGKYYFKNLKMTL